MLRMLLGEAIRRFGDRVAFATDEWRLTFAGLGRLSDAVAAGLAHRGVRPGDVVALALPAVPEYAICYVAAAKIGAVTAGYNLRMPPARLARVHEVTRPRLVVTAPGVELPAAPDGDVIKIALSTDGRAPLAGLTHDHRPPPPMPPDPFRPVAIAFTSGTTGLPKGAVFGTRQLEAIRLVEAGQHWGEGGAELLGPSLWHLRFMTRLPVLLQTGRTTYLMREWSAESALRKIAELRVPVLHGHPSRLTLLAAHPLLDELDLSGVRTVVAEGGPVTPGLVRTLRDRLHVPVCTHYTCTEAGLGLATMPDDPSEDAETTVGRSLPGVSLAIRRADVRTVAPGEPGEVLLRSQAVMTGYWNDPAAALATITKDGFVQTGDRGWIDEWGRLHLTGRTDEVYAHGDHDIFPAEVEAALSTHPGVGQVAVVPRPDPVRGEVGVAVVVPRGTPPDLAEVRAFAAGALAAHELPEDMIVLDELPLTAGDQIDRAALGRLVLPGR